MICSCCSHPMRKLSITTNSGGKFDVDHCRHCGGTWFDAYEINRIPYDEVARITKLTVLPDNPIPELHSHRCPRCYKTLVPTDYESVPKGVKMHSCPKCAGIWATLKALEEFKTYQEEAIHKYKSKSRVFPSLSMVFIPAIFILLVFMVTFTSIVALQYTQENRTKAQSTISNFTVFLFSNTIVSITFQTKTAVKSSITYGIDLPSMTTKTINDQPSTNHRILLTDLTPKTSYIFKITLTDESGRTYTTAEDSFTTKQ